MSDYVSSTHQIFLAAVHNVVCVVFFFQAEDGIRDYKVTGVQTCALPILGRLPGSRADVRRRGRIRLDLSLRRLLARKRAWLRSPRGAPERSLAPRSFRQLAQAPARARPARAAPRRARLLRALAADQEGGAAAPADAAAAARPSALAQGELDSSLEIDDQALALGQQAAALDQAGRDSALDVLDEHLVLGSDLAVEFEQLLDPSLFGLRAEEVVEEPLGSLRPRRQDRPDREVRPAGEDVDHRGRPEEVELAARHLALGVHAAAVLAHRAELARERIAESELGGVGR